MKRLLAGLAFVALAVGANATLPRTAAAGGLTWAEVCCGSMCETPIWCSGDGPLSCCTEVD